MKNYIPENRREKIVHEWNGPLEIFSRPLIQVKETSRQYLLLRTDILQKTVVAALLSL